jgi:hypothetical protein
MKRRSIAASFVAVLACVAIAGTVIAAPKLNTFGSADVRVNGGTVTITTDDGQDPDWGGPKYGGVYLNSKSLSGKYIGSVDFSFVSTGDVSGGAPRFSMPIDVDENGGVDGYAFIDAGNCGGTSDNPVTVGTSNPACDVYFGSEGFANWDAFYAAHPAYRMAPGAIPFIIADGAYNSVYEISQIDLR